MNITTPHQAYSLGFLWGDGTISERNKSYCVRIECLESDLIQILPVFDSVGKWKKYFRTREGRRPSLTISLFNKEMYLFLKENGYSSKSWASANKILSKIPNELHHYWFRGLLDADGSFIFLNQSTGKSKTFGVAFYSGFEQDWKFLENFCVLLDIRYRVERRRRAIGDFSTFFISHKDDVIRFGECLYSARQFGLERKLFKFLAIKNYHAEHFEHGSLKTCRYELLSPQGEKVKISNLSAFCREYKMSMGQIWPLVKRQIKKNRLGWQVADAC